MFNLGHFAVKIAGDNESLFLRYSMRYEVQSVVTYRFEHSFDVIANFAFFCLSFSLLFSVSICLPAL